MYVVEIIPLARTAPQAPLSYRSASKLAPGTIVSVPLRRKTLPGLVVDCVPVREAKAMLKAASFSLSKSTDLKQGKLPDAMIEAAREIALYHATTLGAVLSALLVPVLSEELLPRFAKAANAGKTDVTKVARENVERIEAPFLSRVKQYKTLIQGLTLNSEFQGETLNGATLLVVPTQTEADEWAGLLKEHKPLVISGKLSGERREAALRATPYSRGLVITTPGFAWVPIEHLNRIIIERASAGSYTFPKRPYLDVRYALASLARARDIPLIYGDYPLPLEYRAAPQAPLAEIAPGSIEILDVRAPKSERGDEKTNGKISAKDSDPRTQWQAVPDQLRTEIKKVIDSGGRVAVLAVRRGYSPTVVCGDCSTAVTDEQGRALSLATVGNARVFRSTDGSVIQGADAFCKVCGGWNLKPLGIGIERVEEELRAAFPIQGLTLNSEFQGETLKKEAVRIVRISEDSRKAASLKKVRVEIMEPGTIIIGTEVMLPWLSPSTPVELAVIASADSLLALPFWRSRERFVRVGRMLAERAERTIIATRRPEDAALSALSTAAADNTNDVDPQADTFWKEETELRKILSYPPFGTLIVFHIEGTPARLSEARDAIRTASLPHIPHELAERPLTATTSRTTLVLQLPQGIWPDHELSDRLARLSPNIRIHIDSETLW
jgi:primosomal protein N'